MFKWIIDFFKRLFSNKTVSEIVIKDIAFRTFNKRPKLATQALTWSNYILDGLKAESISSLDALEVFMLGYIPKLNITPEERLLMTVLVGSVKEQLITEYRALNIEHPVQQMGKAAEYINWIMAAAKAAQEEK